MGGLWVAVREDGGLVGAAPTRADLAEGVGRLGGELEAGEAPRPREARAHGGAFSLRVWRACLKIPAGETRTYGEVAAAIGSRGARAVGRALAANPLARIIPCHRVVAAKGEGGFAWERWRKRAWLREERG